MDKEALKALGLTDEQVAAVFEDYGKNYVTKVGRIAGSSFCVKRKIAGSLGPGAGSASHRDRDVCRRYPLSVIRYPFFTSDEFRRYSRTVHGSRLHG